MREVLIFISGVATGLAVASKLQVIMDENTANKVISDCICIDQSMLEELDMESEKHKI